MKKEEKRCDLIERQIKWKKKLAELIKNKRKKSLVAPKNFNRLNRMYDKVFITKRFKKIENVQYVSNFILFYFIENGQIIMNLIESASNVQKSKYFQ